MLNDAKLRAARPRDKAYQLTDSHHLFLLITPSGGKQKTLAWGLTP